MLLHKYIYNVIVNLVHVHCIFFPNISSHISCLLECFHWWQFRLCLLTTVYSCWREVSCQKQHNSFETCKVHCSFDRSIVLSAYKQKKKISFTKNQLENIASRYSRTYGAWKIYSELYDCLERHGNNFF